ncbi:nascent polypeptide-associated complex subunit alpha, muscle-specific form-like isoform X1 [Leopardus geoffroyi]|uniref:nascent polypeptide-associated complex subunit alpha, muscle-specific form-like isoform X1 n=1 Tax=Leopardus geoffroyi TaxID=46844 RepID=UPI001E25DB91|nr:nascent polypeptide-associated complex subunit alpha, muscle-specific form-like isoform X1 [Leopardus geoffroyi]
MRISEEGAEKGGGEKSEARATAPGGGGRGRTPDPLLPTPTLGPRPTAASPSPEGAIERGVGGPHAPHPQPRPGGGQRARRLDPPPPTRVPAAGETSHRLAAQVCKAPSTAWAPGAAAPSGGEGDRGGEEAVNSPSVRASPRRAPLPRPRRGRLSPQPVRGTPLPGPRGPEGSQVSSPEGSGSSRSGPSSREGGSQDLPVITFYAILDPLVNVPTKHYGCLLPSAGNVIRDPLGGDPSPRNVALGTAVSTHLQSRLRVDCDFLGQVWRKGKYPL